VNTQPHRSRTLPRFAWLLLWAALVLPLAQAVANIHAQSHWGQERGSPAEKYGLAADRCDLCLTAAALSGGGAASTPISIAHGPARLPALPTFAVRLAPAPLSLAYQSRAPPAFFR
jgi:hypothetical protein